MARNDPVFQDTVPRRQRPLRTDVSQGKPGLLDQVHLHPSSIYNTLYRYSIVLSAVRFASKFAADKPGDYRVTPGTAKEPLYSAREIHHPRRPTPARDPAG